MFSYGDPDDPREDDPRFETEDAAISAALDVTGKWDWFNGVQAVWDHDTGEILALVHGGFDYRP